MRNVTVAPVGKRGRWLQEIVVGTLPVVLLELFAPAVVIGYRAPALASALVFAASLPGRKRKGGPRRGVWCLRSARLGGRADKAHAAIL